MTLDPLKASKTADTKIKVKLLLLTYIIIIKKIDVEMINFHFLSYELLILLRRS